MGRTRTFSSIQGRSSDDSGSCEYSREEHCQSCKSCEMGYVQYTCTCDQPVLECSHLEQGSHIFSSTGGYINCFKPKIPTQCQDFTVAGTLELKAPLMVRNLYY